MLPVELWAGEADHNCRQQAAVGSSWSPASKSVPLVGEHAAACPQVLLACVVSMRPGAACRCAAARSAVDCA